MYSEKERKEVKDFMKELGFSSLEEREVYEKIIQKLKGKEITIWNEEAKVVGTLHSGTYVQGPKATVTKKLNFSAYIYSTYTHGKCNQWRSN